MLHSTLAGKSILFISKRLGRSGSTWPGHVVLKVEPRFIKKAIEKNPGVKVVLIAGTNGKTTTTKALSHTLEYSNFSVLTNQTGANLLNGLASLLVKHINMEGELKHKALIFEVDENSLPLVLKEIPNPSCIVLLNLFRDQLDRYGEVNTTAEKWKESIQKLTETTMVIANSDDSLVANVAGFAKSVSYFSISQKHKTQKKIGHAVDSTTCPKCNNDLSYNGIAYSHLGNYKCPSCKFTNPNASHTDIKTELLGTYNQYNLNAALLVAQKVFKIEQEVALKSLQTFKPAFGRQETIDVDGKRVMMLLAKNPTGFNESLKVALNQYSSNEVRSSQHKASNNNSQYILILLNDRIPDGLDISWIWDVDFEVLKDKDLKVYVSGDRAYDMANRLLFAGVNYEVFEKYAEAYSESLKNIKEGETLTILPTYSAMLEIRKLISGKSIL